jgi:Hint domain
MQELEARLANARFARRHVSKMAGIGVAALIAKVTTTRPAQAWEWRDHDHDRDDDRGDPGEHHHHHCFLKGTRIRTIAGERNVEALAVGDVLPTSFNGLQPIQWIGRHRFIRSDRCKPWVRGVLPVRVARSAIAADVPHTDLYLSQQHAIFIDGVLARVCSLINETSIALHDAEDVSELEYYHIKLRSHDVVYAEGAPCETLLEVEESAANFAEYLRMYGTPSEPARPCAPVLSYYSNRSRMRSHLRSALSPWIDRRGKIDIIRDRLEERALTLA